MWCSSDYQPITRRQSSANEDTEAETYVDPINGPVTTLEKPKSTKKTNSPSINTHLNLDLSSRLAAVMSVKKDKGNKITVMEKKTDIEPTEDECLDSSKDTNRDNNEIKKYEPVAVMEEEEDETRQDYLVTKSEREEKLAGPQNINRIINDDKDRVLEQHEQQLFAGYGKYC
ncbi:uncharacterized protein BX663DRAFT_540457 [Cokeromyces recurvatus]|uniref:uncharacterized protein n=1 Tax=Cokeromyces recurvatus TaxID=90255 RepID=UPI0022205D9F|nr:uncharacterized protein BX663DRAFT_540457 [Cokeromyces recurvatus]KAI7906767.1 hypothetical protein BX663DRAFT_540457 [Cokeromyces recurvatus]